MFNITFNGGSTFTATFPQNETFPIELSETIERPIGDYYEGPYEFTPSDEEQTVPIAELVATENIKIKPVPSGYGKISWNGAYLTVS